MSFGEERCSSYVLIPPQNHDPAARKRRENHFPSALYIIPASHGDLETLLRGFNQAYNARRQRVLKGRSPEMVVSERLGALPARANPNHDPPFNPCSLPKALQIITQAKDVSHPDS